MIFQQESNIGVLKKKINAISVEKERETIQRFTWFSDVPTSTEVSN